MDKTNDISEQLDKSRHLISHIMNPHGKDTVGVFIAAGHNHDKSHKMAIILAEAEKSSGICIPAESVVRVIETPNIIHKIEVRQLENVHTMIKTKKQNHISPYKFHR